MFINAPKINEKPSDPKQKAWTKEDALFDF